MNRNAAHKMMSQTQAAWLMLMPFLLVYVAFLVYPFLKGIWISLHDWNLMAVAFNPDAKSFVGARNYERILWGRNIEWSLWRATSWQISGYVMIALAALSTFKRWLSPTTRGAILVAGLLMVIATGFQPGEGGRWFDRRFWPTVGNTLQFVAMTVPSVVIISLALATALNRETRAMSILRTLFFLSQVLSVTVVTLIWQMMFSPNQGLIANITQALGGTPMVWLTDEQFAMWAIVITTVWWSIGIALILFLAGLQDLNKEMFEAAALDNATGLKSFWYIALPNLKRTITLVAVLQIILHFQVFGQAHLMTKGGPNDSTQVWVRYIYQTAFRDSELGRASTMAVVLFVMMGLFSVLQWLLSREESE